MPAKTSRSDFGALVRRAGIPLAEAEVDEIYAGWAYIEPMLERLRGTADRDRAAEPAHVFRPDVFTAEHG